MKTLSIASLQSGGVITNYYCSSRCGHCLYGCSPYWEKKYLDESTAIRIFQKIASLGCGYVHIGGGEPLLDPSSLQKVLKIASDFRTGIEYIETNSSWFKDEVSAVATLQSLKPFGINTLLVSISPFHNEHVPFAKVKGVMAACRKAGIDIFPWVQDFYYDLNNFDETKTHSLEEYTQEFGRGYLKSIPSRYWVHFGGRALQTYKDLYPLKSLEEITGNTQGCVELTGITHFHFDLFGNYVPGLCSGLAIKAEDLGNPLDPDQYPLITTLYNQGVKGLLENAWENYGFIPEEQYLSKCHLCFEIRKYLVLEGKVNSIELQPVQFYEEV